MDAGGIVKRGGEAVVVVVLDGEGGITVSRGTMDVTVAGDGPSVMEFGMASIAIGQPVMDQGASGNSWGNGATTVTIQVDPPADQVMEHEYREPLPEAPARLGFVSGVRPAPLVKRRVFNRGRVRRSYNRSQRLRHFAARKGL